ncbi:MAG: rhodanese-like domain-containing protein [Acidobacteriota bacterium]
MVISPGELLAAIDAGAAPAIVDVRTRREFSNGHVPGAVNVPLASMFFGATTIPLSREAPVVVYCGHGPRARIAAAAMRYAGFLNITYLDGHMAGWRRAGLREET